MPTASQPTETTVVAPSKTRVVGATVAGAAVTVILGVASQYFIGRAASKVQNTINPEPPTTEN